MKGLKRTKKRLISWLLVIVMALSLVPADLPMTQVEAASSGNRVVGYFPSYRMDTFDSIDITALTHCMLSFMTYSGGTLTSGFSDANVQKIVTKCHNNGVKAMIAVGGWGGFDASNDPFGTAEKRTAFINQLMDYVTRHNLDGVDIDIELTDAVIWNNYDAFISELSARLKSEGKLLTMAVATWFTGAMSDSTYQYFDFLNLMSYDYNQSGTGEVAPWSQIYDMVNYYGNKVSSDKLVIGVPFYGYGTGGAVTYAQMVSQGVANADLDYANGVYYNGRPTIKAKAEYSKSYGGTMIWEIGQDSFGEYSLLKVIKEVMGTSSSGGETTTEAPTTETPTAGTTLSNRVVGYFPSYRMDTFDSIDITALTHCMLSFMTYSGGTLSSGFSDANVQKIVTKCHNNGVKVMIAIGGWGGFDASNDPFGTPEKRTAFINQVMDYVTRHNLDGVDIDIELEDSRIWNNYDAFISELSARLKSEGKLLTMAVAKWFTGSMQDSTYQYFDFLNLMSYDYNQSGTGDSAPWSQIYDMVSYYGSKVSSDKLVIGVPFYGYGTGGAVTYAQMISQGVANADTDYANGVYYNGRPTIKAKAEYSKSYGGTMIWEIGQDSFGEYSLLKVIKEVMGTSGSGGNTEATTEEKTEVTTQETTTEVTTQEATTEEKTEATTEESTGGTNTGTYPEWKADGSYAVGDLVAYDGKVYECRTPHNAQADWTPTAVAALWKERTDLVNVPSTSEEDKTTEEKTEDKTTEEKTEEVTTQEKTEEKTEEVITEEKTEEVTTEDKTEEKTEEVTTEETTEEVEKNGKRVYLTFDDGPSAYTGQILDILAENDVKATFFVLGKDESYYQYYKRIVDEGHTIGMHSYTHVYENFYASVDSFADELTRLNDLIYDVTGYRSTIFRFPGGSSNGITPLPIEDYIAYLNEQNINYYDWNALNGDAVTTGLSPEELVDNIMTNVTTNQDSIVLMHDLQTTYSTVESLQLLIDTLKDGGYEILPIDENTPLIQYVSHEIAGSTDKPATTEETTGEVATEETTEESTGDVTTEETTEESTGDVTTEETTEESTGDATTEEKTEEGTGETTTENKTEEGDGDVTTEDKGETSTEDKEQTTEESGSQTTEEKGEQTTEGTGNQTSDGNTDVQNPDNNNQNSGNNNTQNPNTNNNPNPQNPNNNNQNSGNTETTVKVGDTFEVKGLCYQITKIDGKNSTVTLTKSSNKSIKKLTVPKTVKYNGVTYKVNAIADKAFQKCKKLKTVVIGNNVTTIGKAAFKGCKNLKTITIKSKKLSKVGAKAFSGIKSNAKIKVPSKKLVSKYKKLLRKKVPAKVKIVK